MNHAITTTELTMRFRKCEALHGVSLNIAPGTVFALLGENGAGKTTMIRILTGFQKPTSGSCSVGGIDPTRQPLEVRRQVGYVSDAPALYGWMTVDQIGWFSGSFYPPPYLEAYRQLVHRYEVPPQQKIRELSRGQRAKVALSLALASDPELLILDEPTSGLDPMVRREFLESMIDRAASGRTVFLSSHQISEVERVADTIGILHEGRLRLCCPLSELKQSVVELTVIVDDPMVALPSLPEPAEVLLEENHGRQRRMIVRHYDPAMRESVVSQPEFEDLRSRDLSLEEIFIAYTTGSFSKASKFTRPADDPAAMATGGSA